MMSAPNMTLKGSSNGLDGVAAVGLPDAYVDEK